MAGEGAGDRWRTHGPTKSLRPHDCPTPTQGWRCGRGPPAPPSQSPRVWRSQTALDAGPPREASASLGTRLNAGGPFSPQVPQSGHRGLVWTPRAVSGQGWHRGELTAARALPAPTIRSDCSSAQGAEGWQPLESPGQHMQQTPPSNWLAAAAALHLALHQPGQPREPHAFLGGGGVGIRAPCGQGTGFGKTWRLSGFRRVVVGYSA